MADDAKSLMGKDVYGANGPKLGEIDNQQIVRYAVYRVTITTRRPPAAFEQRLVIAGDQSFACAGVGGDLIRREAGFEKPAREFNAWALD